MTAVTSGAVHTDVTWTKSTEGDNETIYDIYWQPKFPGTSIGNSNNTQYPQNAQSDIIDSKFQLKIEILRDNYGMGVKFYYLSKYHKHFNLCQLIYLNNEYTVTKKDVLLDNWNKLDIIRVNTTLAVLATTVLEVQLNVTDYKLNMSMEEMKASGIPLHEDFESLMKNETFSDVALKSIEGKEYKVHKAIIAARSDVLRAHFYHNTTECNTNIIDTPLESEVLQVLITFMYTDLPSILDKFPVKLLIAADYYQITRLKSLCEISLGKTLNVENAIETLQLAEKYSATSLKKLTMQFIKDIPLKLIMKTEGWHNLESIELIKAILEYVYLKDE